MYAVKAGANQVYGCEVNKMLFHICDDILKANGLRDNVISYNMMSTDLRIPDHITNP